MGRGAKAPISPGSGTNISPGKEFIASQPQHPVVMLKPHPIPSRGILRTLRLAWEIGRVFSFFSGPVLGRILGVV